jgi:vacuolar-type H+-ATPase subunit F/Vma7
VAACGFIGDEVTAAGFRLAGARVYPCPPGDAAALFRQLASRHPLLVLTAEAAARVPEELLQQAAARGRPLLLVVADAAGREAPPDPARALRRQLGMGA